MTARLGQLEQPDLGMEGRGNKLTMSLNMVPPTTGEVGFFTIFFVQSQDIIWLTTTEVAHGIMYLFYIWLNSRTS